MVPELELESGDEQRQRMGYQYIFDLKIDLDHLLLVDTRGAEGLEVAGQEMDYSSHVVCHLFLGLDLLGQHANIREAYAKVSSILAIEQGVV